MAFIALTLATVPLWMPADVDSIGFGPGVAAEARAPIEDVGPILPVAGSTVPINGRIVFAGANDPAISFVRVRPDETGAFVDDEQLTHTTVIVDPFQSAHIVDLPADIVIGEQIVVQSRCASCSFQGEWTITNEDTTPPAFNDGPARITGEHIDTRFGGTSGGYFITVELPGASDARSDVVVELRGDIDHLAPRTFTAGAPMSIFTQTLDDSERTACVTAVALDSAGNETTLDDVLCVELVRPRIGGCTQSGASPSSLALLALALALALALVFARRRRGRA